MNNPEETRSVVIEKVFTHSPAKVWRALTESPLLAQWLLNNDFEPMPGHKFKFRADPVPNWDGIIDCEVLVIEPLQQLSYTWSAMGLDSVVLFELTPTDTGTHLRMRHSGFRADQQQAYGGAMYGWNKFLKTLESVLDGGLQ